MKKHKIAIVGPESTGKSILSKELAQHYSTAFVPEYAREYMEKLTRAYTLEDIVAISKEQHKLENFAFQKSDLLFCDTNLLVTKIWAENAFKTCPTFISNNWKAEEYSLHLLMQIDLPWQYDPLREHPNQRQFFFDWYERELKASKANYSIIAGSADERTRNAIQAVSNFLSSSA